MPITIDGDALLIVLPSATSEIDVETDLYSEWKKWTLLDDNLRFEQAFRPVAGDPLTGALEIGAYFFLRNDLGWRIRPAEEDATVNFTGNLVAEDSSLPVVVPTLGGFTALLLGLQPVTQNVEIMTSGLTEDYPVDGQSSLTPAQLLYSINQLLSEFARSGTIVSVKRRDGTEAYQLTLDSATAPTSSTQST